MYTLWSIGAGAIPLITTTNTAHICNIIRTITALSKVIPTQPHEEKKDTECLGCTVFVSPVKY